MLDPLRRMKHRRRLAVRLPLLAAALCLFGCMDVATAREAPLSVREAEMASCQPGELTTWGDGSDRPAATGGVWLHYQHAGAPAWFNEAQVRAVLLRASQAWSGCGVAGGLREPGTAAQPQDVVVAWSDPGTRGNFALADVGQRRLWLSAGMFALLAERNPRHPAHETLQMTLSHEMGHFYGLMAHSRRCVDVMSYYHDGQGHFCHTRDGASYRSVPEYRALLPTACDLSRCRAINMRP